MVETDNLKGSRANFSTGKKPQWTSDPSFMHGRGHTV
jgi:hypothetical protein